MQRARATSRSIWIRIAACGAAVGLLAWLAIVRTHWIGAPWLSPSIARPLGTDEFGRDLLATAVASGINSLLTGLFCTIVGFAVAVSIAFALTFASSRFVQAGIDSSIRVLDGVPVVLWVLVMAFMAPSAPRLTALGTFLIAILPYLIRIAYGAFARLQTAAFVETARMQELRPWRLLTKHLLPNSRELLLPAFAQVCGLAVAVDGAIAIIGSANRTELSIGVLLLRGKEQFPHPLLMVTAVVTTILVYLLISVWVRRWSGKPAWQTDAPNL